MARAQQCLRRAALRRAWKSTSCQRTESDAPCGDLRTSAGIRAGPGNSSVLHGVSIGSATGYDNAFLLATMTDHVSDAGGLYQRGRPLESPVSCMCTLSNHVPVASGVGVFRGSSGGVERGRWGTRADPCRAMPYAAPGLVRLRERASAATVGDGLAGIATSPHRSNRQTVEERSPVRTFLQAVARCSRCHETQGCAGHIARGDPPQGPVPVGGRPAVRSLPARRSRALPVAPQ